MKIQQELNRIQKELKAPKNQRNKFGNYNYRSCEDILEGLKPILGQCTITISDSLENVGDRYYVKATASLTLNEESVEVSAYARETETRKGMDDAQITGSASSYARKYALNGLFAIDDTKDADTNESKMQEYEPVVDMDKIRKQLKSCGTLDGLRDMTAKLAGQNKSKQEEIIQMGREIALGIKGSIL